MKDSDKFAFIVVIGGKSGRLVGTKRLESQEAAGFDGENQRVRPDLLAKEATLASQRRRLLQLSGGKNPRMI